MFYILSKTIGQLWHPLPLAIMLLAVAAALWRRRPRYAAGLTACVLIVLWALSTDIVAGALMLPLERPYLHLTPPPSVDMIIVLGGSLDLSRSDANHAEMADAADRFIESILLAKRYPAATIVYAGGTAALSGQGNREAPILKTLAQQLGIPAARIIAEAHSRNTHENAAECSRVVERLHPHSVLLVTSAFHMRRALACFHAAGLEAIPYGTDFRSNARGYSASLLPDPAALDNSTKALREYVGIFTYHLRGYL